MFRQTNRAQHPVLIQDEIKMYVELLYVSLLAVSVFKYLLTICCNTFLDV